MNNADDIKKKLCEQFIIIFKNSGHSQISMGELLNVSQAKISLVVNSKTHTLSVDFLMSLFFKLGHDIDIVIKEKECQKQKSN